MTRPFPVALVAGLALAAVMSYPLVVRPGAVTRFDSNDGKFSVWNVAWVAHAMTDRSARLFDANIFHPHRGTLAFSEANLVAGAMAVPVYVATGNPIAAYNSVVFAALVLAFLSMWALVRRLTGSPVAGLLSATGFAFCAYVSAHTAHIQLLMVFVIPLAMLDFHRFVERPTIRRAVGLGLALAIAGLACGYYGIFSGLAVGLGLLWFARGQERPRQYWLGVLLAVAVGGALVAPALRPYVDLRRQTGFKSEPNLEEARMYSADTVSYLRSGTLAHQQVRRAYPARLKDALQRDREVLFPGFIVTILAIIGLASGIRPQRHAPDARRPIAFYAALTALAVWASLGPGAGLYTWLADWVPMISFLRAPARVGVIALFGAAVLAGFGAARLAAGRWSSATTLALVLAAVELKASWPLVAVPPVPEVYRHLATLPRAGTVELHFPYRRTDEHQHARYMFWSMWHWQPLVNGYSDFIPPDFYEIAVPVNYFPDPASFRILKARDVRYVIVHLDMYSEGPIRESMQARFPPYADYLRLIVEAEGKRLYEIVRWPD